MSQNSVFMLIFVLLKEYLNIKQLNPSVINFIGGFFLFDLKIIIDNKVAILLLRATPHVSVKISVNNTDLIQNDLVIIPSYRNFY